MIKPLTSCRFFFALMVFFSHIDFIDKSHVTFHTLYQNIFQEGYLGVSFFFILSGFILTLNYKDKILSGEVGHKEFWMARLARIYPLHFITTILCIPLTLIFFNDGVLMWGLKLCLNLLLLQSFVPAISVYYSFNAPSWSISDEMFFYLIFPFLIILYNKCRSAVCINLIYLLLIPIGIYFVPSNLINTTR